jgi:hypothetical protein
MSCYVIGVIVPNFSKIVMYCPVVHGIYWSYIVASKSSKILWYNLQELLLLIKKCTLTTLIVLGMRLEGNTLKKGAVAAAGGFSLMSVPHHTVGFGQGIF